MVIARAILLDPRAASADRGCKGVVAEVLAGKTRLIDDVRAGGDTRLRHWTKAVVRSGEELLCDDVHASIYPPRPRRREDHLNH